MSPAAPLLEFQNLCFERNDVPLFDQLGGEVRSGEILQVSGANGAGKTTLLRVLATALRPTAGEIRWRGDPLPRSRSRYLTELVFLGHAPGFKSALSPRENLRWLGGLFTQRRETADTALAALGLAAWADVPCAQLSAGMLRRAALARLPLSDAALWILDEPLTALDRAGVGLVEELFRAHLNGGGGIIFSSHQPLTLPGVKRLELTGA